MDKKPTVLVIDAGNSFLKIALFENGEITRIQRIKHSEIDKLTQYYDQVGRPQVILTSVLTIEQTKFIFSLFDSCFNVNRETKLPIRINYKTIETLGFDRICNAVAIHSVNSTHKNGGVSIDIGTCIKFDFVDEIGTYQGGSISPGIDLRYKSMNDYTANLPLLNTREKCDLIGKSTHESIQSGVINGIKAEIDQLIQRYSSENGDLTFFVTGGDAQFFDFGGKNGIFVNENLTLIGLYQIYLFNAH
ncbi:MAG: type III pantothenate kinase [Crocinitomicaceae bacterium]|nr:MAG: type III pantothenate kinase [Crocinitomicaceae bacterium]